MPPWRVVRPGLGLAHGIAILGAQGFYRPARNGPHEEQGMNRYMAVIAAALLACTSGGVHAQDDGIVNFGKIVGGNAANGKACGATQAQVDAYKAKQQKTMQGLYAQLPNFSGDFDKGYKQGLQSMQKVHADGTYKPDAELCKKLLSDMR
ncbi:hypothetical protein HDC36_004475 [Xanthomonas sp. JAI131]|uniref:hypothetical protein n=1 Tax=Xanthomonas sp. JAI131 TaxID=2723067 RepID=UPI0015C7C42A|nr:hypothetical protein [Xanthomonas sp. JAI131]NYF22985.1 hypothetical protein [Xanthomonas sp. JAI131]